MSTSVTNTARVLKSLTDRPGMVVYKDDIVNETGLPEHTVRATIANIRQQGRESSNNNHPGRYLEIVARGQAWMYKPNSVQQSFSDTRPAPRQRAINHPVVVEMPSTVTEPSPKSVAHPVGKLFEFVGKTGDGSSIIKDEKGRLFKVIPL